MTEDSDDGRVDPVGGDDLYVYTAQDIGHICAELQTRLEADPDVGDDIAAQTTTMVYDLLTGDWQSQDSES